MSMNVGWVPEPQRIVHETKADFSGKQVSYKQIHVVQYDRSLPIIAVELYKNGLLYTIPTNATIKIRWGKKDRTFIYKDVLGCDSERHIVYFDIDEQMSIFDGLHKPILEVTVGGQSAGSTEIPIMVDRNPVQMNDIMSESPYPFAQVAVTGNYYDLIGIPETLENIKVVDALPSNLREVDLKLLYRVNGSTVDNLYVINKITESGQTSYVAKLLATQDYVSEVLAGYVDLTSNQNIEGIKTFKGDNSTGGKIVVEGPLLIKRATDSAQGYWRINPWGTNGLDFKMGSNEEGIKINGGTSLQPLSNGLMSLGSSGKNWKDLFLNENLYLGNSTTAGKGIITFQNPVLTNQGDWCIDSPDQNGIRFMQKTQNTGVKISRGIMYPLTTGYFTLGNNNYRWKTLFLSHYVDWGNNVMIGKDSSNRFYVTDSAGNTKIKVGQNETYFVNHVEPDSNNTYDLGRLACRWRTLFLTNELNLVNPTLQKGLKIYVDQYGQPMVQSSSDNGESWQNVFAVESYYIKTYGLKPLVDNSYYIGNASLRYKMIYTLGISDNLTSIAISDIATQDWVMENAGINVTDLRSI